jgi:phosphomannomutase
MKNYLDLYSKFLVKFLKPKKKLRVVFDSSNGTTGLVIRKLKELVGDKLEIILINDQPDGNFPAHGPDPLQPGATDQLAAAIKKHKADLGAIFDSDGDRAFFVDNRGRMLIPDAAIILLAENFKGPALLTINIGMLAREHFVWEKRRIYDSRVGHYFVKQVLREKRVPFGAESSGHYYFKDFFFADSGILASLFFINSVSRLGDSLSKWIDALPKYYRSGEINFRITRPKEEVLKLVEDAMLSRKPKISKLDGVRMDFGDWWCIVRASNTEPLIRLNVEAKDKKVFERELAFLSQLLSKN